MLPRRLVRSPLRISDIDYDAALACLEEVRLQEKWSYNACAHELSEFGAKADRKRAEKALIENEGYAPDYFEDSSFADDANNIYKALKRLTRLNDFTSKGIFLWMFSLDKDKLLHMRTEARLQRSERLVGELRGFFRHGADVNLNKARDYSGCFEIYRPSHIHPKDEICVNTLTLGEGDNCFNASIQMEFRDQRGRLVSESASGKFIPMGERGMIILVVAGRSKGKFVVQIDNVQYGHSDDASVDEFWGTMLAAVDGHASSAWPFYALRAPADSKPRVLDHESLASLPRPITEQLARGMVDWDPSRYLKSRGPS